MFKILFTAFYLRFARVLKKRRLSREERRKARLEAHMWVQEALDKLRQDNIEYNELKKTKGAQYSFTQFLKEEKGIEVF